MADNIRPMPKGRTLEGIVYGSDDHAQVTVADNTRTYRDPHHGATVSVHRDGPDWEGRTAYTYEMVGVTSDGTFHHTGHDLRTGVGVDHGPGEMLATLLSFLTACAESISWIPGGDGENADLFPRDVAEWAAQHYDELTMLALEIEEGDDDE